MNTKKIDFLKKAYKKESDAKVRERLLMLIYSLQGESSWKVGDRLNCDHALVLYWKKRYEEEGIEGLRTRPRSGKPKLLSKKQEEKIKKKIAEEDPLKPWTTKRVHDLIEKETKIDYTQRHVQRLLHKWGFGLVIPRQTFWQRASREEVKRFWKKILYYKRRYPDYPLTCEDESTFIYDSVSRKVWAIKGRIPKRFVTGSHKKIHVFGFFSEKQGRLFKQNDKLNSDGVLKALYAAKYKFGKMILIVDRASWHRSKKVRAYFEKNRREIKVIYLPVGCPEMNPVEECWRQAKKEVNGGKVHKSFDAMRKELRNFLKYKKFNQDAVKYLRP